MSNSVKSVHGRPHDAEKAREAILNAAEAVFTEHGFDGARIDAIAAQSGYNKSLIFQYFGDKLNLYAEVTKRADKEMSLLQENMLVSVFEDETVAGDAHKFKFLLETIIGSMFDYLVVHPRLIRILNWEQAERWQTYKKIFSQFDKEDMNHFEKLFNVARKAGLLRSDFNPVVQLTMALQVCLSYLSFIPLYEMVIQGEDFSSRTSLEQARRYITTFVVSGIMRDPDRQNAVI